MNLSGISDPAYLAVNNTLTIIKQFKPDIRVEDLVIAFSSLFQDFPLEITHNICRMDIRTNTEFLYKRALVTKPDTQQLSICGLLRGKENLFGLTKDDRNLELYNASKLEKHIVKINDVKLVSDSLTMESSHRERLESYHLENNPDNFAETRYIEYSFIVEALGSRTMTTTNKSGGGRSVLAVTHDNRVFIREYFDPETPGWRHVTCGLYVALTETNKVNDTRMAIINDIVMRLDHLC